MGSVGATLGAGESLAAVYALQALLQLGERTAAEVVGVPGSLGGPAPAQCRDDGHEVRRALVVSELAV